MSAVLAGATLATTARTVPPTRAPAPGVWGLLGPGRRAWRNRLRTAGGRGVLHAAQLLLIGGIIWGVLALVAARLLGQFARYPEIAALLTLKVVSVALAVGFGITFVAATIAALGVLFLGRETRTLLVAPVDWLQLYLSQLVRIVLHGSGAAALVITPVLMAVGVTGHGGWRFWAVAAVGAPCVLATVGAAAVLAALALARLAGAARARSLLLVVGVLVGGVVWVAFRASGTGQFLAAPSATDSMAIVDLLGAPTAWWLPTEWWARALVGAADGLDVFALAALLGAAGLATTLAAIAYDRWYEPGALRVTAHQIARPAGARSEAAWRAVARALGPIPAVVMRKDLARLRRETAEWSHWILTACGLGVFFLNLRGLPQASAGDPSGRSLLQVIALLTSGVGGLVLASLAAHTVLPGLSLEAPLVPHLRVAPVRWRTLVWTKAALGLALFVPAGAGIAAIAQAVLQTPPAFAALAVALSAVLAALVVALAAWFGARYPRFDSPTPAAIASSIGATLFTLTAFAAAMTAMVAAAPFALTRLGGLPPGALLARMELVPPALRLAGVVLALIGPLLGAGLCLWAAGRAADRWSVVTATPTPPGQGGSAILAAPPAR